MILNALDPASDLLLTMQQQSQSIQRVETVIPRADRFTIGKAGARGPTDLVLEVDTNGRDRVLVLFLSKQQ
jgi:hypothetical protein